jgi:hypothetical protein
METYSNYSPSAYDTEGLGLPERQDWYVVPCARNRESNCLAESNFAYALEAMGGEGDNVEIHRFGHWTCGWFEIIIVRPNTNAYAAAREIEESLEDYSILDEEDYDKRQMEEAHSVWKDGYTDAQRLNYIRKHKYDFEFHNFTDLLSCVRGNYFAGSVSELLG